MVAALHLLAFGFLSPWLMAAGGAATSIPIIIHLLNKRKFRIVIWAAMEWLLAAQRRNARRLRFQRWLLLAIRCLAILIIAAGIAQLVLQNTALGSFLGEQHAIIILWDDSYSMGYQQDAAGASGAATAFEQSKRKIADYVNRLNSGDKVMIIRASTGGQTESANAKPTPDHQAIISQLNAARITDAATDLPSAFDRARQVLADMESSTRSRQLLLVTDLSYSSIHDPKRAGTSGVGGGVKVPGNGENRIEGLDGAKLKKAAQGAVAHLPSPADFHIIDEGVDSQTNTAVTGWLSKRPLVVAGVPTDLQVEVFNGSDRPLIDEPVTITIDGVPAQSLKIGKVEPASFQTASVSITLPTAGRHLVEARAGSGSGDALPIDDTRRLMLNVRKEIAVLLVDGSPGDGGRTSYGSTFYLQAAYALPVQGKPASLFAPKVITELELPTTPLTGYDIVVLSDTSDPPPATRESLQKFVADGGLLIIFPGERTNAQRINDALGDKGANLLPATLGQVVKLNPSEQFDPENFQKNPVMQVFAADYKAGKEVGLLTVQTTQYLKLGVPTDGSTDIILRYAKGGDAAALPPAPSEGAGDAAVVLRRGIGANADKALPGGTVILFASSADMVWNTWGAKASYLPFIHELTFYGLPRATLNAGAGLTLDVGSAFRLPGDFTSSGPWTGPRDTHFSITQEVQDGHAVLTGPPLVWTGTYGPGTGDTRPVLAVNPDSREADIRHVQKEQMAAALGADVSNIIQRPAILQWQRNTDAAGSWFGPSLVLAALGLFLLEAILALAFSTYR